ncbi:MAG: zinc metallopeptidase [Clostridia bacterium]|nr:zinc metallopeptidase [Clostridia bacterium]
MPFFYLDYWYLIFVIPPMLLAIWASFNVNSTFKKYSKVTNRYGLTGAEAARKILDKNGLYNVRIERVAGDLTDHFDPKTNVVRLSSSVHDSTSVAAVGVAAHEAGHAVQYAEEYTPMKIRGSLVGVANIGSTAGIYLAILGIILSFTVLAYIGIGLFCAVVAFQLVTLPVEFNASRRAVVALEQGYLSDEELRGTKKVLRAAALTYVAALLSAIGNLLRLIMLVGGRRRD